MPFEVSCSKSLQHISSLEQCLTVLNVHPKLTIAIGTRQPLGDLKDQGNRGFGILSRGSYEAKRTSGLSSRDGNNLPPTSSPFDISNLRSNLKTLSNIPDKNTSAESVIPIITITPSPEDRLRGLSSNTPSALISPAASTASSFSPHTETRLTFTSPEIKRLWSDYDDDDFDLPQGKKNPKGPPGAAVTYAGSLRSNKDNISPKPCLSTRGSALPRMLERVFEAGTSTISKPNRSDNVHNLAEPLKPLLSHSKSLVGLLKAKINYSRMPKPLMCLPPTELAYWEHTAVQAHALYAAVTGEEDDFNHGYRQMLSVRGVLDEELLDSEMSPIPKIQVKESGSSVSYNELHTEDLDKAEDITCQEAPNTSSPYVSLSTTHSGEVIGPDNAQDTQATTNTPTRDSAEEEL